MNKPKCLSCFDFYDWHLCKIKDRETGEVIGYKWYGCHNPNVLHHQQKQVMEGKSDCKYYLKMK